VDDHSRRVDDTPEPRPAGDGELLLQMRAEISRVAPGPYVFTRAFENLAGCIDGKGIVEPAHELVHRGEVGKSAHLSKANAARALKR
jgi:hypothetical protein